MSTAMDGGTVAVIYTRQFFWNLRCKRPEYFARYLHLPINKNNVFIRVFRFLRWKAIEICGWIFFKRLFGGREAFWKAAFFDIIWTLAFVDMISYASLRTKGCFTPDLGHFIFWPKSMGFSMIFYFLLYIF